MIEIATLPLHDAIVQRIIMLWRERTVEFELLAFSEKGKDASPHMLRFLKVTYFTCPHVSPWGESFHINSASGSQGHFIMEMQSGDEIKIEAGEYNFTPIGS
jgi:hypothetical protein